MALNEQTDIGAMEAPSESVAGAVGADASGKVMVVNCIDGDGGAAKLMKGRADGDADGVVGAEVPGVWAGAPPCCCNPIPCRRPVKSFVSCGVGVAASGSGCC